MMLMKMIMLMSPPHPPVRTMSKASLCLTQDGIPNVDDDDDNYDINDDDIKC